MDNVKETNQSVYLDISNCPSLKYHTSNWQHLPQLATSFKLGHLSHRMVLDCMALCATTTKTWNRRQETKICKLKIRVISKPYPLLKSFSSVVTLYSLPTMYYESVTKQLNLSQKTVYYRIPTCNPDQINKGLTPWKHCIERIHCLWSKSVWYFLHPLRLNHKIYKQLSLTPLTFKDIGPYLFFFPRQFYFRPCPEMRVLYLAS